jgi:hypothetical protein
MHPVMEHHMLNKKPARTLANLFAVFTILLTACQPATPVIKVESSSLTIQAGETVNTSVVVENVSDLTAIELHLSFDPVVLEVVEIKNGGFVAEDFVVQNAFDNAAGTIDYAIAQIDSSPVNGTGTVLEVTFRAKNIGFSNIQFKGTDAAPSGVLLSNSDGAAIEITLAGETLTVK